MIMSEVDQIQLLNKEHREISLRIANGDYSNEKEKQLLEEILEENLWSLKVLATAKEVVLKINPFDLIKEVINANLDDAFLYCIMRKEPIASAVRILRVNYLSELTGSKNDLAKIIEIISKNSCQSCKMSSCQNKQVQISNEEISILKDSLPYEKYVWSRYRHPQKTYEERFRDSYCWIMGIGIDSSNADTPGLSVESCFEFVGGNLEWVRKAFKKINKVSVSQAIDFYKKFKEMPEKKISKNPVEDYVEDLELEG